MAIEKQIAYEGQRTTSTLDSKVRLEQGNGRLIVSDGINNIGLFGYDSVGNIVVKIAKSGYNADTATNDQLVFNSAQNIFKIVKIMNLNVLKAANSSDSGLVSAAHGLSFIPAIIAYASYGIGYQSMPISTPETSATGVGLNVLSSAVYVDSTNIYGETLTPNTGTVHSFYGATVNLDIKVYLMQETAA